MTEGPYNLGKLALISGAALLVMAAVALVYIQPDWMGSALGGEDRVGVHTAEVGERTVVSQIDGFGRAKPSVEVSVRSEVSGEIRELFVQEGDRVKTGDPLVRLRDDDYVAAVRQARAGVFQARAQLSSARADSVRARQERERTEVLASRQVMAPAERDSVRAAYRQATARVRAAQAAVEQAQADLDQTQERAAQTRLQSPIDGIVTRLNVEVGERVLGSIRVQGTEIMRLGGPEAMEFTVPVPEDRIPVVDPGDPVEITTEAYEDQTLEGVVVEVANAASAGEQAGANADLEYSVRTRVTSPHVLAARMQPVSTGTGDGPVLRPGMSGTVRILADRADSVAAVPQVAVTTRNLSRLDTADVRQHATLLRPPAGASDDLRTVVFLHRADRAHMVEVATGLRGPKLVEIARGVAPGDTVVAAPEDAVVRSLDPGTPLRSLSHTSASDY